MLSSAAPVMLDLCCCAGGAGVGFHRAGFDVVGVDIEPQPNYPFRFVQADALEYVSVHGREFDAIHASPPCQRYSMIQRANNNRELWPDMVGPMREQLQAIGKPWVMENVEGAPLRVDLMLCGSEFGLGMIRHRVFEFGGGFVMPFELRRPCNHRGMYDPWHRDGVDQLRQMSLAMGIDWMKTRGEVREAIPPAYTEYIGRYLMAAVLEKHHAE